MKKRVNGWVDVRERLPELTERNTYQPVLVWDKLWQSQYLAWFAEDKWEALSEREDGEITHWQPLPAPPEKS